MKKLSDILFPAIVAATVLVSCKGFDDNFVSESDQKGDAMIFNVAFDGVKATISDGKVTWTTGDKVTVYDSDGNFETVEVSDISNAGATAKVKTTTLEAGKDAYYAVYPVCETAIPDGDDITVAVPAIQTNATSHIAVAKASDGSFSFKNVNQLIKFAVADTDVKYAVLSSQTASQTIVYGNVKASSTTGEFVSGTDASTAVSKEIESGDNYLAIAPGIEMTAGFTIELQDASHNALYTFRYDKAFTSVRSKVTSIKDFEARAKCVDLSATQTANCYIVPAEGYYRFKATTKGNSTKDADAIAPASVKYLWSTYNSATAPADADQLITGLSYGNGYATFKATGKQGNVIVAAYDSNDKIIWSWHLWCCAGITNVVHQNAAGKLNGQTMLDRNLGALSNHWSDDNVDDFGFFYEWGRKDPFVSACLRTVTSTADIKYAAVHGKQKAFSGAKKTVEYSIANPTTFINPSETGDWLTTRDNTLWAADKTIYDPCPVGYAMPTTNSGPWGLFTDNTTWEPTYKGRYFTNKDNVVVWHPAMGFLYCTSGKYSASNNSLGINGKYWSYYLGDYANTGKAYRWHEEAATCSLDGEWRASGLAVRCQKK